MPDEAEPGLKRRFFLYAVLFEGGLGIVALAFCLIFGLPFLQALRPDGAALLAVLPGTAILLAVYFALKLVPLAALKEIEGILRSFYREYMAEMPMWKIAVICLAAGFGEEMFFRGFLQSGLFALAGFFGFDAASPAVVCLVFWLVSAIFALGHAATKWYLVLAFFASLYFCTLYYATGNLLTAMLVHALYDFVVFLRVRSECRRI